MTNWLSDSDWKRAQDTIPITCVDVVPVRIGPGDKSDIRKVGLIHRDTPHQGRRWCVVGGRLWRNESLAEAITRQLHTTLGDNIRFDLGTDPQPVYISQYFTEVRNVGSFDPRQHAVTLNFCIALEGEPRPMGEANDFRWFDPFSLPSPAEFGFGQDEVVAAVLAAMSPRE